MSQLLHGHTLGKYRSGKDRSICGLRGRHSCRPTDSGDPCASRTHCRWSSGDSWAVLHFGIVHSTDTRGSPSAECRLRRASSGAYCWYWPRWRGGRPDSGRHHKWCGFHVVVPLGSGDMNWCILGFWAMFKPGTMWPSRLTKHWVLDWSRPHHGLRLHQAKVAGSPGRIYTLWSWSVRVAARRGILWSNISRLSF